MRLVSFSASPRQRRQMAEAHSRGGEFRKVGEHFYRNSANKTYYAVFKVSGKRIWKKLETTDRELANPVDARIRSMEPRRLASFFVMTRRIMDAADARLEAQQLNAGLNRYL